MTVKGTYGKSSEGNFEVVDTIGVPHPYCIGPKHVDHASRHFSGMLGEDAIRSAEKMGAKCETCKGQLKFDDHEQALLVKCLKDFHDPEAKEELHQYLLAIKEECEKNRYAGFTFLKAF